jgi:hypothetical protein
MLQQYEELAVLDQGDDGAIVSIRGQDGPSVVLGAAYLHHLDKVLAAAICDIEVEATGQGVKLLCAEIQTLLSTYQETQNKFYGGGAPHSSRSVSEALCELREMRRQLDQFR